MSKVANLLIKLLENQSFRPESSIVPNIISEWFAAESINSDAIVANGVTNIVASTGHKIKLILNAHWDTVLPDRKFAAKSKLPVISDGKVIKGIGACDMKAGVAAMMIAFAHAYRKGIKGLVINLVGDEETGGQNGTQVLIKKGYTAPYVILGEPTNLKLSRGQKGSLLLKATFQGESGHAAYPQRGSNAILAMQTLLNRISGEFPNPAATAEVKDVFNQVTAVPTLVSGGDYANVIPAKAELTIDFRLPPQLSPNELIKTIKKLTKGINVELSFSELAEGWVTDSESKIVSLARESFVEVMQVEPELIYKMGSNDGKYYSGSNLINLGPGDNRLSHSVNEEVAVKDIEAAIRFYTVLIQKLLDN